MPDRSHRGSIFLEDAEILVHEFFAAGQYVLRVAAKQCASRALPGSFVHIQIDDDTAMRRPMSIMRASGEDGWIEILYKEVGHGTVMLAKRKPGERISVLGPIGKPFQPDPQRPRSLLIGGGVGVPPMIFVADHLRCDKRNNWKPFILMGSEIPFPFTARPSQILVDGLPDGVIACMPLLDDWGIPSRLASLQGYAGCFEGYVTDLARAWLSALPDDALDEVEILSCGPTLMLKAVSALAREFKLPCQVSLEEYMACAVGGCAGCVVEVQTENGPAMKRVCVDGPVFDAYQVFPA
ncbi:MAG: dihydroorotate dehydrogenase electron transfer subunit [Gammaproteobacteria bacterium]